MARAYFCNCLPEPVAIALNSDKETREIAGSEVSNDHLRTALTMMGIEMHSSPENIAFTYNTDAINTLMVKTLQGVVNRYDLSIARHLADGDVYYFVFSHTLTGQTATGVTRGVSIDIHEAVRRVVQDGITLPGIQLPPPPTGTDQP